MRYSKFVLGVSVLLLLAACSKTNVKEQGEAGLESTSAGLRLMANYDSKFDTIFERYRLLTITFANQSPNLIELDPQKDVWTLQTRSGASVKAINNLRFVDAKAWNALPPRAQELIEYPHVVLRNTTVSFDLVFPKSVDLKDFKKIDFYCKALDQSFTGGSMYGEVPEK